MFRVSLLTLGFFVLFTSFANAGKVANCDPWVGGKEPPVRPSEDLARDMSAMVNTIDACSDERVVMIVDDSYDTHVQRGKTRTCNSDADRAKYGCNPGQVPPKACIEIPTVRLAGLTGGKYEVSKCDKNALRAAITSVASTKDTRAVQSLASSYKAGEPIPGTPGPTKDVPFPESAGKVINKALGDAGIKDPDIVKKVENDARLRDIVAKGGNPVEVDNRLRELGLNAKERTQLTENVTAMTPGEPDSKNKEKDVPPAPSNDPTRRWDCLVSTNPIYVLPGKYGPGCINYGWPENTSFSQPYNQENSQQPHSSSKPPSSSSASPFSLGSMLEGLMKNFGKQLTSPFNMGKQNKPSTTPRSGQPNAPQQTSSSQDGMPLISDVISGRAPYAASDFSSSILKPVMTIIAQRKEITAGQSMSVSWSSLRVLTDPPCTLTMSGTAGDREIAEGRGGTKTIATAKGMSGTVIFTLRCLSLSKEEATASTTVSIK